MNDRTGHAYEELTARIMTELGEAGAVETTELERRKIVQGRTTRHEIDVWWVFRWSGQQFTVLFQCKSWNRPVEQGELLKFQAVLADLAEWQPTGVFVTKVGYQQGSANVARGNRISVVELREMTEDDWAGRLKTITVSLRAVSPQYRNRQLQVPPDAEVDSQLSGLNRDLVIVSGDGSRKTMLALENDLIPAGFEETSWQRRIVEFPAGSWLTSQEDPTLQVPALAISMDVRTVVAENEFVIGGSDLVMHVMKNVLTGATVMFNADGTPRSLGHVEALDLQRHGHCRAHG
jgi:hypothetical protein